MSSSSKHARVTRLSRAIIIISFQGLLVSCATSGESSLESLVFRTPDEAVGALVEAVRADRLETLVRVLGPESRDLLDSGDEVADRSARDLFLTAYGEKSLVEQRDEDTAILRVGELDWPFPIPIVRTDTGWAFDAETGKEEILDRRIGRNELNTIEVCLAFVEAQRDYARKDWDGDGLLEYAQKVRSAPGERDGLYWEVREGEEPSPIGPLIARAVEEGYAPGTGEPQPYHGYFFRSLKAQGPNANGGAYDYMVRDSMVGGFALVAHPAVYGVSGVKTFMTSHDGVVFEKDLGEDTAKLAAEMTLFDPDPTWTKATE